MAKRTNVPKPFLKWAGGKRHLINQLKPFFPDEIKSYYEPFLGGGSVFMNMNTSVAHLNDFNEDLIITYKVVKENVDALIQEVERYPTDRETYYAIRAIDRDKDKYNQLSEIQKAARLIYLNKLCFSGLYRVNSRNEFNVSYAGYDNPKIIDEKNIRMVSDYLNLLDVRFYNERYNSFLQHIEPGSFVFINPPHDARIMTENNVPYYHESFTHEEQEALKKCCDELNEKDVKFLLLNSPTEFILNLYKDYKPKLLPTKNFINSKGRRNRPIYEAIVRNF